MKHSKLLLLAAVALLALGTGCRNRQPLVSKLPGDGAATTSSSDAARRAPDLNTAPLVSGGGTTGSGVVGAPVLAGVPDAADLANRPMDRTRFAAETVYFDFDRAEVRAAEASKISHVASAFKSLPAGHDILVEGHCDERGTEGYNQALGERRALAARELLIKEGVDGSRVFTKSLGKDQPAQLGHDEAAWSKNRRAEFILVLPGQITTTQNSQ